MNINVDIILQSVGRDGTKDISFTVAKTDVHDALNVIEANMTRISGTKVEVDENVAKVSLVGAGMASNAGVASMMFEALYDADVNIKMISTSEIKISVLVDANDTELAMNEIHEKFKMAISGK